MKKVKTSKVTMYKSTDGKLHESNDLCEMHEANLAINPQVEALLMQAHGALPEENVPFYTAQQVCEFVRENTTQLFDILLPLQPKKPRVPRKPKVVLPPATTQVDAPAIVPVTPAAQIPAEISTDAEQENILESV